VAEAQGIHGPNNMYARFTDLWMTSDLVYLDAHSGKFPMVVMIGGSLTCRNSMLSRFQAIVWVRLAHRAGKWVRQANAGGRATEYPRVKPWGVINFSRLCDHTGAAGTRGWDWGIGVGWGIWLRGLVEKYS